MNIKNNSKFIVSNNLDYENISKTQLLDCERNYNFCDLLFVYF